MLSCAFPAKLSAGYLHGFVSVQHAVSHLPAKLSASYLHGFVPVQHAVSHLPAKLPANYFHGFVSVQHAVSLPPSEAPPKLFPQFRVRPTCCIAPSRRSFPQATCTVSCPSSMLYRSFPAKLSASYFHGLVSVQHALSLPPSEAFRRLFPRFGVRPACCIASSSEAFRKLFPRFRVSVQHAVPRERFIVKNQ